MKQLLPFLRFFLFFSAIAQPSYSSDKVQPDKSSSQMLHSDSSSYPEILKVKIIRQRDTVIISDSSMVPTIRYDDKISFLINNCKTLLNERPNDASKLILYINGYPIAGIKSEQYSGISNLQGKSETLSIQSQTWVGFILNKDSLQSNGAFKAIIPSNWFISSAKFSISTGWEKREAIAIKYNPQVSLVLFNIVSLYIFIGGYILFIVLVYIFCLNTSILKEDSDPEAPFNFASAQLAFWTVIVFGGFIYLFLITDQIDFINNSVLILLGINASSTGVSNLINNFKNTSNPMPGSQKKRPKGSKGFFEDILSNKNGIDLKHFVALLWNLALGIYFIWYVLNNKTMPTFSTGLLLLAGVNSLFSVKANEYHYDRHDLKP